MNFKENPQILRVYHFKMESQNSNSEVTKLLCYFTIVSRTTKLLSRIPRQTCQSKTSSLSQCKDNSMMIQASECIAKIVYNMILISDQRTAHQHH